MMYWTVDEAGTKYAYTHIRLLLFPSSGKGAGCRNTVAVARNGKDALYLPHCLHLNNNNFYNFNLTVTSASLIVGTILLNVDKFQVRSNIQLNN